MPVAPKTAKKPGKQSLKGKSKGRQEAGQEEPDQARHRLHPPRRGRHHELRRLWEVSHGAHQGRDTFPTQGRDTFPTQGRDTFPTQGRDLFPRPRVPFPSAPSTTWPWLIRCQFLSTFSLFLPVLYCIFICVFRLENLKKFQSCLNSYSVFGFG